MTAPTPLERLEQALAELGKLTPDGIADLMRAKGIKGMRVFSCHCVLARYLASLGIDVAITARRDEWIARLSITGRMADLPPSVAEFASRFDNGVYLDLVEVLI